MRLFYLRGPCFLFKIMIVMCCKKAILLLGFLGEKRVCNSFKEKEKSLIFNLWIFNGFKEEVDKEVLKAFSLLDL